MSLSLFYQRALFAFELRSREISVLLTLIAESILRDTIVIKSVFETGIETSEPANVTMRYIMGLTLS